MGSVGNLVQKTSKTHFRFQTYDTSDIIRPSLKCLDDTFYETSIPTEPLAKLFLGL